MITPKDLKINNWIIIQLGAKKYLAQVLQLEHELRVSIPSYLASKHIKPWQILQKLEPTKLIPNHKYIVRKDVHNELHNHFHGEVEIEINRASFSHAVYTLKSQAGVFELEAFNLKGFIHAMLIPKPEEEVTSLDIQILDQSSPWDLL